MRSSRSRSGRSVTHSRSRSRSRYRTRSRTRSKSRYSSETPPHSRKRKELRSPRKSKSTEGGISKLDKPVPRLVQGEEPKAPAASSSESVSVLPLSDSPPPSRWKPGQKPWKPSYVRIQEINVKSAPASNALISPSSNVPLEKMSSSKPDTAVSHKGLSSSNNNVPDRLLQSSLSRSRSRSQSRSSSKSLSQCGSRSSSCTRSESYGSNKEGSTEKKRKHCSSHKNGQNRDKHANHGSGHKYTSPSSEDLSYSPYSPLHGQNDSLVQRNTLDCLSDLQAVAMKSKNPIQRKAKQNNNNASGWESEGENSSKNTAAEHNQIPVKEEGLSETKKRQILARCWESESDSEMPNKMVGGDANHVSEKEEGEASSESEDDDPLWSNHGAEMLKLLKSNEEQSADKKLSKHKKKAKRKHKHKRKNTSRSGSRRTKAKKSKKHQKPKETFHWQPPLEFGDEGEEDDSVTQSKQLYVANPDSVSDAAKRHAKSGKIKPKVSENKDQDKEIIEDKFSVESAKSIDENGKITNRNKLNRNTAISAQRHPEIPKPITDLETNLSDTNLARVKSRDPNKVERCSPERIPEAQQPGPKAIGFSPLKNILNSSSVLVPPQIEKGNSNTIGPTLSHGSQPEETVPGDSPVTAVENKWKPLKDMNVMQAISTKTFIMKINKQQDQLDGKAQGLKIEIKSKSRVRPGSLFDEVRKTARLNQRPRNPDSSSEEDSLPATGERAGSLNHSQNKSRSVSSHRSTRRSRSHSYSHSRSRSRSYTYTSRLVTTGNVFLSTYVQSFRSSQFCMCFNF